MKKIILIICIFTLLLTGCGRVSSKDVLKELENKLNKSSGYHLEGELEITNHDEVYNYNIEVDTIKDKNYKVKFINLNNGFEQIILKNDEGVFLLSPSLNKSFKFQSDWPYVHSQIYLIEAIIRDIKNDKEMLFKRNDNGFTINTKVDYPNNRSLASEKITIDNKYNIKSITIYDSNDVICMKFNIKKLKYSPKYNNDFFSIDNMTENVEEEKSASVIEDVIYPLLLPEGTKLVNEEKVTKSNGERVIMTYDGEKSFLLVEETLDVFNEFTVIPTSGEPYMLMDTIGVVTDNSLSWSSGNMEYYLVSDVMSREELVEVAQSIVGVQSFK